MLIQSGLLNSTSSHPQIRVEAPSIHMTAPKTHSVSPIAHPGPNVSGKHRSPEPPVSSSHFPKEKLQLKESRERGRKVSPSPTLGKKQAAVPAASLKPISEKNKFLPPPGSSAYALALHFYPPNFPALEKQLDGLSGLFTAGSNPELLQYARFIVQQLLLGLTFCQVNRRSIGLDNFVAFMKALYFAVHCQPLITNSGEVGAGLVELVLKQLIYEDEKKEETGR